MVRIAADEAVRKAEDPLRVARLGAADLIVVKVPPLGGVDRAAQVVRDSGLDAVVSSALDTSVGLAAGLALAARLESLPYACGLGTAALLTADVVDSPLLPVEGALRVPVRNGRVVAPEPPPRCWTSTGWTGRAVPGGSSGCGLPMPCWLRGRALRLRIGACTPTGVPSANSTTLRTPRRCVWRVGWCAG
ncbi:enolase C-terminal domain-like protein [Nesterenkonia sp. PF2B19]|uniref:enolase C-terminal domain-like protein n=1 Tax=Nesterenkonia sp. PF2B19 TaxID=1881858 RepID=UPI003FA5CDB2